MRTLALLAMFVTVTGCATYSVRRSALVPHLAPPGRSGQPLQAPFAFDVGTSSAVAVAEPSAGTSEAGIFIPRYDVNGGFRARLVPALDVGLVYDHGFRSDATSMREDQPAVRGGDVYGGGVNLLYSAAVSPTTRLGVFVEMLVYSVPWIEYRTCIENCAMPYSTVNQGRKQISVNSLAVIPSHRVGRWTLFGSLTLRNHPTIAVGGTEVWDNADGDVHTGPFNLLASVGGEVELGGGVRALMQIYQPLTRDPVTYAPTVAATVTLPLGDAQHR